MILCLNSLSIHLIQYQNPCTCDNLYWGTLQWDGSTSLHISYPVVESLNETETAECLASIFRIQRGGKILDGDADLNMGAWYEQWSEETGERTKMHLFPSLLHSSFLECKFFRKKEIVPAFALL